MCLVQWQYQEQSVEFGKAVIAQVKPERRVNGPDRDAAHIHNIEEQQEVHKEKLLNSNRGQEGVQRNVVNRGYTNSHRHPTDPGQQDFITGRSDSHVPWHLLASVRKAGRIRYKAGGYWGWNLIFVLMINSGNFVVVFIKCRWLGWR